MQIQITTHGATLAKTYGNRRLHVLAAAVLPWNKTEYDIAKATGFGLTTVQSEMKGLYTTGAIVNARNATSKRVTPSTARTPNKAPSKVTATPVPTTSASKNTKRLPLRHITDAQVLQTFQAVRSKTKTGAMLGMSRTGVRDRLSAIVAKSGGKIVL